MVQLLMRLTNIFVHLMTNEAAGEDFLICLTEVGKVYKLNLSIPTQAHHHSSIQTSDRESIRASFLDQSRTWELLPNFSEPDQLDKYLSKALANHVPDPRVRPKITHISAQYRSFVSYSVSTEGHQGSLVFMGRHDSGPTDEPEVIPGLQKRGVIQLSVTSDHSSQVGIPCVSLMVIGVKCASSGVFSFFFWF